ncbi:MAG TPA: radical SAM/SPASM domain-containing protein [Candidatus Paceibacterota bacterium]|nr:radical SAM/SPASM domain-containing protein [Verrucomicrobiota bacterium]HRY46758.1 radical SAM/SPASM domain-containing protein [Candidatus Paceibacterota bacterium]
MLWQLTRRFLREPDKRLLCRFAFSFGWRGMRSVRAFQRRQARGIYFPAFMFISITSLCNLRCQGCWVSVSPANGRQLDLETLDRLIVECKKQGSFFFGLLGGEPLLHPGLFELIGRHRDCYFQLFSNGTTLTESVARTLRSLGNVTPLISIEGIPQVSDERRGGRDVYRRAMAGLEQCRKQRLITGVATSVCQSNFNDLVSDRFVDDLIQRGVLYLWYYIYRPVGPNPSPELCLNEDQILRLRQYMVDLRTRAPIVVVDAYWDQEGRALCPAAVGISHHINPAGDVEPCPVVQFARENVKDGQGLVDLVVQSEFLGRFRDFAARTTRGCVLLDRPDLLRQFLKEQKARDTSGRETAFAELEAMVSRPGHHLPGREIPEKHWVYRFAKKHWFFGFGAYG